MNASDNLLSKTKKIIEYKDNHLPYLKFQILASHIYNSIAAYYNYKHIVFFIILSDSIDVVYLIEVDASSIFFVIFIHQTE